MLWSYGYEIGEIIGEGFYVNVRRVYFIDDKKEVVVKIVNKLREVKIIIVIKI